MDLNKKIFEMQGTMGKEEWQVFYKKYRNMRKSINEEQKQTHIYLIQLFDYNCPSGVSGVTKVFVDDIKEFSEQYLQIEKDKNRKERFLRSKAGEIVTDYYSDDPQLNIVKKISIEEFGWDCKWKFDQMIEVLNGYMWPSYYCFELLFFDIRWVRVEDKLLKLVKPKCENCCQKSPWGGDKPFTKIGIYGNPFWFYREEPNTPFSGKDTTVFRGTEIESYVWHVVDSFETQEDLAKDKKRTWLLKRQIQRAFSDLPGDAG